ncbi:UPF0488 protein CG14286 [Haemaphysalis longicornis]
MHRRKKLPVQKLPTTQNTTPAGLSNPEDSGAEEDAQEKFERELRWCIEQLDISLTQTDAKKKIYSEHMRALQTLKNEKAPIAKKRQVMSMTLGNYREKMKQQEAKFAADYAQRTRLQPQCSAEPKSVFLKKTATSHTDSAAKVSTPVAEFKFNFAIDTEDASEDTSKNPTTTPLPA